MSWILECNHLRPAELREQAERLGEAIKEGKQDASKFSIREQFNHCFGRDANRLIERSGASQFFVQEDAGAVASTAFSVITGNVLHSEVIKGYEYEYSNNADQLCRTVTSKRRQENIAGFTALEGLHEIAENMPYHDSGLTDKYVTVTHKKYGRKLSITMEAIQFDETGQLLNVARGFGMNAAATRARQIFEGVIDKNSTVYQPSGTAEALYNTSARTGQDYANATTGVGTINAANLETVLTKLRMMKTDPVSGSTDANYIMIPPQRMTMMVHPGAEYDARTLVESSNLPGTANNDTNVFRGMYSVVVNPYVANTTDWYIGDFQTQFIWSEVAPVQTFVAPPNSPDEFDRDVPFQMKVRFMGAPAAVDYVYVHKASA